jgi:Family of unknown function (DUF5681)
MPSRKKGGGSGNFQKPPVEHRFKKGQSGNPNGRPRKKRLAASGGGITDRLHAMALDEATRLVTVREGDKVSKIPALQAVFRIMFRAASQGDTKAGRQILDVIASAESGRADRASEILRYTAEYKERYLAVFEKHEREGLAPPEIYPHPDDLVIDETTGEVSIDGPISKEQAGARKAVREQALESMLRYFEVKDALVKDPTNRQLKREFNELKIWHDFLLKDAERNIRLEVLRLSRRASQQVPERKDDDSDEA